MRYLIGGLALFICSTILMSQEKKELEKLEGKWQPTMMQLGESKTPADQLKNISLSIDGEKYHVVVNGQNDKGTLKLDPKAKPKTMDITGAEGPNKGKTFPAIYEIDGDTLKICYALSGTKRPKEFKAVIDGGEVVEKYLLVTYQKAKQEKKK